MTEPGVPDPTAPVPPAGSPSPSSAPPAGPKFSLRGMLGDSGALMIASIAAVVAGLIRTKVAAVQFGPDVVAILAQLTQLYVLVLTISVIGLGTGIRVVLAKVQDGEQAAGLGKLLVGAATLVSLVFVAVAVVFAESIARELLGSPEDANHVRVALLAVPFAVALQTGSAVVQARGEFRALASASIVGGFLAAIVTVLLMLTGHVDLAVASLPAGGAAQLLPLFLITPTGRRLVRARWFATRPQLRELVTIGGITFGLTIASSFADTAIRARFVDVGGLDLVARLQPAMVFSTQGFGLVLGAISATVLVRVTEQLAAHPDADVTAAFNSVGRRLLVIVGVVAFAAQAFSGLAVVILFSDEFLSSTALIAGMACGDLLRAFGWIFGAALLPQALRLRWAMVGLSVTVLQFTLGWFLLDQLGASGYVIAYITAWGIGAVLVVLTAGRRARVEVSSSLLGILLTALLAGGALLVTADTGRLVYLAPLAGAVALLVVGLKLNSRGGGTAPAAVSGDASDGGRGDVRDDA